MNNSTTLSVTEQDQLHILSNGLKTADRFINKNYLINLSERNIVPLDETRHSTREIRLYQIEKLVFDKEENINDKLISVYSSLLNINSSVLFVIDGGTQSTSLYIGVRSYDNASVAGLILEKSFLGNFPGSSISRLRNDKIAEIMDKCVSAQSLGMQKNISCVTVVPASRDEDKDKFVQGMEKFLDTMRGETYTAVFIAQPMQKQNTEQRRLGLEELYAAISPFAKTTLAYGENYSKAVTNGMCESFSHSVNSGISNTTGTNTSNGVTKNSGFNIGIMGSGANFGSSRSYTTGTSWSNSVTKGSTDSKTTGTNTSTSETDGNSRTLTVEHHNKTAEGLMQKIDEQLKRIKDCEGFGMWECACYFLADDIQTSIVAANTYKALMLGDNTSVENSYINVWDVRSAVETKERALSYIKCGIHPIIEIDAEQGYDRQYVTPGNHISGKELPILFGLPHKSIAGVSVSSMADFGRNVIVQNARQDATRIRLGRVHHMGKNEDTIVDLDLNSFTSHCFVTGSTGPGKSNTTYCLLEKFYQNGIPFLVIEPAKGEYKEVFGGLDSINIFTTNPAIGRMLKINPFSFPDKIHILEHLDRLIEIFNACWEMYAAMPAILKDAIERIYIEKGWDLLNSVYRGKGQPEYPTFADLLKTLPNIINRSGYSSDTKGDYIGALVTRVNSLTNGISGQIFCDCYDIPDSILFDENTIVDLSRVGSMETKSLIMGILVLKLSEYRIANANQSNSKLRHITVLEEAHNLLKNTSNQSSGNNVIAKSVEMICNSIAEMRTYGEGFIIVDQSPTAVDIAAIKNTNTKILMRLPEKNDCDTVGKAAGLNDEQIKEMSKLETGVAVVIQNNWLEAVLTHIDAFTNAYSKSIESADYQSLRYLKGVVIIELMEQYIVEKRLDLARLLKAIDSVDIVSYKKHEMKYCVSRAVEHLQNERDIGYFSNVLYSLCGANALFDIAEVKIKRSANEGNGKYDKTSLIEWQKQFELNLADAIDIPDKYVKTLVDFLLYVQEERNREVDYYEVQRILKQDIK